MSDAKTGRRELRIRALHLSSLSRYGILIAGAVLVVVPYGVQFLSSGKTLAEITNVPPRIFPRNFELQNYADVFATVPFASQLINSAIITVLRVTGQVLFSSAAAFAFARLSFPGRKALFGVVLAVLMVPSQLFIVPLYELMAQIGWVNTLQALFVPGMFSPFGVFLMYQTFKTLPRELDEAARLDGCSPVGVFFRILLPLAKPGVIAVAILTAVWSWNDFLWPLVVTNSSTTMPVSVGLALFSGQYVTNYPEVMAGAVVATAPVILLFTVLQRYFVAGLASTGFK